MAFMHAIPPEFWANVDFECGSAVPCGWRGKGSEAICEMDDMVRCPKCHAPADRDNVITWVAPTWVSSGTTAR